MALIALGVCGGIGAYKAVEIARGLQKRGHEVAVIMTRSARRFVGPVTFEAISRRRVITDQFAPGANSDIEHIQLATDIGLLLVAPATANVIGKFAHGIADDFLTSLYLATRAPVLMAPAMNTNMLEHEAVRTNLEYTARRAACGSSILVKVIWRADGSAKDVSPSRRRSSKQPRRSSRLAAASSAGARSSPPDRPTKISTTSATSGIGRAAEWGTRWRLKPRAVERG